MVMAGAHRRWRMLRVTLAALAALGLLSVAIFGGETPLWAQEAESDGVGIALSDLSDYPTHLTVDRFLVELSNLTATETYRITVSSDSANVGIGGCGTSQKATVTGVEDHELVYLVYACAVGEATVTAEVRLTGASSAEASVSQRLTVEAIPENAIGAGGQRVRAAARNAVPKAGTPGSVPSTYFSDITSNSARAKWGTPSDGGTPLKGFGLQFWRHNDVEPPYSDVFVVGAASRSHNYTGLEAATTYKWRIHACNGPDSCGIWTVPIVEVTTLPTATPTPTPTPTPTAGPDLVVAATPGPVRDLEVTGVRDGKLTVDWKAPDIVGVPPVTRYRLQHAPHASNTWTNVPDVAAATTEASLAGLTNGAKYDVRVKACNGDAGGDCGKWVAPVCGVPGTTTIPGQAVLDAEDVTVTRDRELQVTWDPPTCVSAITLYEVQHKKETAATWSNPSNEVNSDTFTVDIGGLTVGTPYQVRVRACNTARSTTPPHSRRLQCGLWSDIQTGTPSGRPLPTPGNLDVLPLPQRMARVSWEADTNATHYVVAVQVFGETAWLDTDCMRPGAAPSPTVTQPGDGSDPACDIDLDAITTDGGAKGLADNDAYRLQVTAYSDDFAPSAPSRTVTIIDTPITVANGHSTSGTSAALTWTGIHDGSILGSGYARGTYEVRYRVSTEIHARAGWRPNKFGAWITPDPSDKYEDITGTSITIDSLTSRQLYAIQLIKRDTGFTSDQSVFAARNVYVWPSNRRAIAIDSNAPLYVGGIPLRYPMTTKTYEYRICTETFPAGQEDKWVAYLEHAFDQWEFATNNLVSMTYNSGPCTDFSEIISEAVKIVRAAEEDARPFDIDRIAGDIKAAANMLERVGLSWNDSTLNEIIMFDDVDMTGTDYYLWKTAIFPEIAPYIGHLWCWGKTETIACAVPTEIEPRAENVGFTTDIFIRRERVRHDPLILPGGDTIVDRDDIPFNTCPDNSVYGAMVHEAGHALGLRSGAGVPAGHPYDRSAVAGERPFGTVMWGELVESSCSPQPIDIMAIYALYQSRS